MADAWWSTCGEDACIRIRGVSPGLAVQVRPASFAGRFGFPSMAGRVIADGPDTCFVPGFPFVGGTEYVVESQGQAIARLVRPPRLAAPAAHVIAIRPSAIDVP